MRLVVALALLAGCKGKGPAADLPALPKGIPVACVEYRGVFEAVITCDEIPDNARTGLEDSYVDIQQSWKDAATMTPSALRALELSCDQATDALRRLASTQCTLPPHIDDPIKAATALPQACLRYKRSIEALGRCDQIPQQSRDALKQNYDAMSQSWQYLSQLPPETVKQLDDACRTSDDAAHQIASGICDLTPIVEAMPAESGLPGTCQEFKRILLELTTCEKLPQQARDALLQSFHAMEQTWKDAAAMPPESRKAMSDSCKTGVDALNQTGAATCGW